MLSTISSRATLYDVVGYLVPGCLAIGIGWLWLFVFDSATAIVLVRKVLAHSLAASLCITTLGYIAGHLANSVSSVLLERLVFKRRFERAKRWHERMSTESPERLARVAEIVRAEFGKGLQPQKLTAFDLLIRMEEKFPNTVVSGFSFLSFYGMNRTLAMIVWLGAIPVGWLCSCMCYSFWGAICAGVVGFAATILAGCAFANQYLRFVEYYYDFLGSTLLHKAKLPDAK